MSKISQTPNAVSFCVSRMSKVLFKNSISPAFFHTYFLQLQSSLGGPQEHASDKTGGTEVNTHLTSCTGSTEDRG